MALLARKLFSRSRFWLIQTVRHPGRTIRRRASHRRAGAETFSNSTVTASAAAATAQRRKVIGSADHLPVGHLGGGFVLGGAQDARPVAHPLRGLDEHPSQLPAADDAQRCRWIENRTSPPLLGLINRRTRAGAGARAHTGESPTASV